MASKTYQAFAFLRDDAELTLDLLESQLHERVRQFPSRALDREDVDELRLRTPDGSIRLWLREGMRTDNAALAADLQDHPLAPALAACVRRLDIWTSDKDPNHLLRPVFHSICAATNEFAGVIVLDVLNRRVFDKGQPADSIVNAAEVVAETVRAKEPSVEELYQRARAKWQAAIDLDLDDDPASIRATTGLLQKAIRQNPNHVGALALLSDLLAALTAYEEAAACARHVAELEPTIEQHQRWLTLLDLPTGKEKRQQIMAHLGAKWRGSKW